MKVMIAYDGSDCADAAISDLHRAGLPREADALVICVAERWLPGPSVTIPSGASGSGAGVAAARQMSHDVKEAYKLASQAKSRIQSFFTGWRIEVVAASGSPAREIRRVSDEWGADLIVLGCQGRSDIGRFLLGSVPQKILNEAHCSVRVCRGSAWKDVSPVRIVIGLDGSRSSEEAVEEVAGRAWPMGSEVRIIAVIDPSRPEANGPRGGEGNSNHIRWVDEFVSAAEGRLRAVDLNTSRKIEEGDPKRIIVVDADEWGADCIVLGASASAEHDCPLGDVATAVVARARCSVEVVRTRPSK